MGAGMDPKAYGPWGTWLNTAPQAPVGGVTNPWTGPTAGAGFNFFDPNAMAGMFTGLMPGVSAPAAAPAAKAPAAVAKAATGAAPGAPTNKLTLAGDALFKLNKSSIRDLSKEGKAQLDDIVGKIKAMGEISQIKVVGHADPTGKQAATLKLSQARAKSVKSYLVSQGVKSDVIISSGVGDGQPVVQCDAKLPKEQLRECHAPNRRVEIEITAKSK
jgi:outer membrane protein OmpA-like peptidoglycan-associated protein